MMKSFDFLKSKPAFLPLFRASSSATDNLRNARLAIGACRSAMELGIRWVYEQDKQSRNPVLEKPEDDTLFSLMTNQDFRELIGSEFVYSKLHIIRRKGNDAIHGKFDPELDNPKTAEVIIECLYVFYDWIYQKYALQVPSPVVRNEPVVIPQKTPSRPIITLKKKTLQSYVPPAVSKYTENLTRKIYIDALLEDAGWVKGKDWLEEFKVTGMPNRTGDGFIDYVLLANNGEPLAIVEAKRTSVDPAVGEQQAYLYAKCLKQMYGREPVIYLSNGIQTWMLNDGYPKHRVYGIYSKEDLLQVRYRQQNKLSLAYAGSAVDESICNRYYQKTAIHAVCEHFNKNFRRALLVMATGSGKTRTVLALVKILLERHWVKNVLFLADRISLVSQAHDAAKKLLPDVPQTNLCDEEPNRNARLVFSTYPTIMGYLAEVKDFSADAAKQPYTAGHFDLIITDEAHRSIYKKYAEIFDYFDSLLVGLTATPKDQIDHNTYKIFGRDDGDPNFSYGLKQAVEDKFLVPYTVVQNTTRFMRDGIKFKDLKPHEQDEWLQLPLLEDKIGPEDTIPSSAVNAWLFNKNTIRKVLDELMNRGLKIDYGNKIGKTIIFARNHEHAKAIVDVFNEQYPMYGGKFCLLIDNQVKYCQSRVKDFCFADSDPQIAVSVDMLDTGVDVPSCLNLVFFKPVKSSAKFWQMVGRGTRLCPKLIDGQDKTHFLVYDWCNNFPRFLAENPPKEVDKIQETLEERIFNTKSQLLSLLDANEKFDDNDWRDVFAKDLFASKERIPSNPNSRKGYLSQPCLSLF